MAFNYLTWLDVGAPTLSGSAGSLISVLDACLVNGYGSKTPLGWTKEFSGTNLAAYRQNGTTNNVYLRINDTGTTSSRCILYGAMTDVNTGTDPTPTETQVSGGGAIWKSNVADTSARAWVLFGNEKSFYLIIADLGTASNGGINYQSAWNTMPTAYFFGDFKSYLPGDQWNKLITCLLTTRSTRIVYNSGFSANDRTYVMRSYTQIGQSINSGTAFNISYNEGSSWGCVNGSRYPDPISGGMRLGKVFITEPAHTAVRGEFPGHYVMFHSYTYTQPGDEFDGTGEFFGKKMKMFKCGNYDGSTASTMNWVHAPFIINDAWGSY